MRMIDADALMKAMYHRAFETDGDTMWQSGCWVRYRAIEQVIKEQPIIERKTGKWIKKDCDLLYCSECDLPSLHPWPYCKRCGAKMDF